jgi:hypothetical protein
MSMAIVHLAVHPNHALGTALDKTIDDVIRMQFAAATSVQ